MALVLDGSMICVSWIPRCTTSSMWLTLLAEKTQRVSKGLKRKPPVGRRNWRLGRSFEKLATFWRYKVGCNSIKIFPQRCSEISRGVMASLKMSRQAETLYRSASMARNSALGVAHPETLDAQAQEKGISPSQATCHPACCVVMCVFNMK